MNTEAAIAHYRRAMDMRGQRVQFRRYCGTGNARTLVLSTAVPAVLTGSTDEPLIGNMREGERGAIVIVPDVAAMLTVPGDDEEAAAWPAPLQRGDEMVLASGEVLRIERADMERRKIGSTAIAYELTLRGS